jgi:GNAT superfamily N-acetyltransferase
MTPEGPRSDLDAGHWIRRAVRLRLDLQAFDNAQFVPYLRRCGQSGIAITTMADLGDTAERGRELYELEKTCAADIPGLGEFATFDEDQEQRLQPLDYDPRGIVVAVISTVPVGMSATSLRLDEGCAVSDMTGVLPSYRGRGISIAMKLRAIDFARSGGARWLFALHHPANAAAIGMNRRLGFIDCGRETA